MSLFKIAANQKYRILYDRYDFDNQFPILTGKILIVHRFCTIATWHSSVTEKFVMR